jgi:hypothetical protein
MGRVDCVAQASDSVFECSGFSPIDLFAVAVTCDTKPIDPHQPGAKLDQDKDRWDLLMDFAPFDFVERDLLDMKQISDIGLFVHERLFEDCIEEIILQNFVNPEHVVKIATYGAKKYTDGGWLSVPNGVRRYRAAAIRHRIAMETEECDSESGLPHVWHVEWNLWAVYTLEQKQAGKRGI